MRARLEKTSSLESASGQDAVLLPNADYRHYARGRAAHEPAMMVALLVYAYATEIKDFFGASSVAAMKTARFEVITANQARLSATG